MFDIRPSRYQVNSGSVTAKANGHIVVLVNSGQFFIYLFGEHLTSFGTALKGSRGLSLQFGSFFLPTTRSLQHLPPR